MDAVAGDVDTSLNLGLRGEPDGVANDRNGGGGGSAKKESEVSVRELEPVVSEKKGLETLRLVLSENYDSLVDGRNQDQASSKRKKGECYCSDEESWKRPRESNRCRVRKVYYRVDASDMSLVVKDGHQWRKYGQKVTRDNPSPRAYFKCSFSPSCPVKKKVQRSVDNPRILIAAYEGEHNHRDTSSSASSPTATHQTKPEVLPKTLIQQMATSLTMDRAFTSVIAEAISVTVLRQLLAPTDRS